LRQLIGDFWEGFVKNFRNEMPPPNLPLGGGMKREIKEDRRR
jgi:hypothetical protein